MTCIVLVGITFDASKAQALLAWVQENKAQGAVLFFCLYTLGVVLMLPAMVMAMASGAIFGLVYGSALAWAGSSIGQIIAFMIGRYLLREIVVSYLTSTFPKWTAIDRALVTDGWKLVTLLRMSPIAPWNILNYALAVTSVPLFSYVIASSLSILPYLLLFVYFGSLARNLADVFTGAAGLDTKTTIIMGMVSAIAMVGVVWYTTHVSRRAVNEALQKHADELPPEITGDAEVAELLGQHVHGNEILDGGKRKDTIPTHHELQREGAVVEMAPLVLPHRDRIGQVIVDRKNHAMIETERDSAFYHSPASPVSHTVTSDENLLLNNQAKSDMVIEPVKHIEEDEGFEADRNGFSSMIGSMPSYFGSTIGLGKAAAGTNTGPYGLHVRSTHTSPRSA